MHVYVMIKEYKITIMLCYTEGIFTGKRLPEHKVSNHKTHGNFRLLEA